MTREYMELFDRGVDRGNTGCEKWDNRQAVFGCADVIPMWVADMDFAAPQAVIDVLTERVRHGAFGYAMEDIQGKRAVAEWLAVRHHLAIETDWVRFTPGVVDSLNVAVAAFSKPGDLVAVQPPVYGPFYRAVTGSGCQIYRNRLVKTESGWRMDLNDLEQGMKQGVRLVLLCSPHNPVGRIWTFDELNDLASLCRRYGARVVADEIHADFEMPGHVHRPILSVMPDAVMLISATKSFNLAALRHSSAVIADECTRELFADELRRRGLSSTNLFGALAQCAAYRGGGEWMSALNEYIDGNRQLVAEFTKANLPEIVPSDLQGSYLQWLDMRALHLPPLKLSRFLIDEARVGLSDGEHFGEEGAGYMRMNLATPRKNVEEALERIEAAVRARRG